MSSEAAPPRADRASAAASLVNVFRRWTSPVMVVDQQDRICVFNAHCARLLELEERELLAEAGSLVTAPIGDPHTFFNADPDAPATLLCSVTPERYLGYFRDLADLRPGPDGVLVPADVLEVMARYSTDPYRP